MKLFVVLAVTAAAAAAPQAGLQPQPQDVKILHYEVNNANTDKYSFSWGTSDGSLHVQQGQLNNQGTENEAIAVRGLYSWEGPDGVRYTVTYVADENGFRPTFAAGQPRYRDRGDIVVGGVSPALAATLIG